MTQEQKAKAYDKAIIKAKELYNQGLINPPLEHIFPELAESEDEKIRKELIDFFSRGAKHGSTTNNIPDKDIVAWLEKQGELKPADKVEPKFKVGDWIVWKNKCYKVNYNGCGYELVDQNGFSTSLEYGIINENAHLWTIQDAKDGDVLIYQNDRGDRDICIFDQISNMPSLGAFCCIDKNNSIYEYTEFNIEGWEPATKEQRDTLMKAMADAGYTFDFEKKELKKMNKIEQKTDELPKGEDYGIDGLYAAIDILQNTLGKVYGYQSDDGILEHKCAISAVKELYERKSTWSEEDETRFNRVLWYVENPRPDVIKSTMLSEWLKSLKDRLK